MFRTFVPLIIVLVLAFFGIKAVLELDTKHFSETIDPETRFNVDVEEEPPTRKPPKEDPDKKFRDTVLAVANNRLYIPYGWGEESLEKADCSGWIYLVLRHAGYPIHRITTRTMAATWEKVGKAKPADIPLFSHNGKTIAHAGIWKKPKTIMFHSSTSMGSEKRDLTSQGGYWKKRLMYTVRVPR